MLAHHILQFQPEANGARGINEDSLTGWLARLIKVVMPRYLERSMEVSFSFALRTGRGHRPDRVGAHLPPAFRSLRSRGPGTLAQRDEDPAPARRPGPHRSAGVSAREPVARSACLYGGKAGGLFDILKSCLSQHDGQETSQIFRHRLEAARQRHPPLSPARVGRAKIGDMQLAHVAARGAPPARQAAYQRGSAGS